MKVARWQGGDLFHNPVEWTSDVMHTEIVMVSSAPDPTANASITSTAKWVSPPSSPPFPVYAAWAVGASDGSALRADVFGSGNAIFASADTGICVQVLAAKNSGLSVNTTSIIPACAAIVSTSSESAAGIRTSSNSGIGVVAHSRTSDGVQGTNGAGCGFSVPGGAAGLRGDSDNGFGVIGTSATAAGVHGESNGNEAGVQAISHAAGAGLRAQANGSGAAVHAIAGKGTAGFFEGPVTITGATAVNATMQVSGSSHFAADVKVDGVITVEKDIILAGADCAEEFDVDGIVAAEPGSVMVFNDDGALTECMKAYDRRAAGVISGAGDYRPAITLDRRVGCINTRKAIALIGKVYCKVDADISPISIGDLLTTSTTPGYAMKACDSSQSFGSVMGKALASLPKGKALIPMLVMMM